MDHHNLSRLRLLLGGAAVMAANRAWTQPTNSLLTVGQVLERIKAHVGVPWREQTVDRLIAGGLNTPVNGIATTMMATLDVLQRAAAAGKNMVITHESTFFSHQDTVDQLKEDPVYRFKTEFIREHNMVSFHFHDHWHRRNPD